MRLAAYAGTSTVLATGVILRAFHERANFYSACVYLSQSNACLMVLTNLVLLLVCLMMLGLQRLLYGPLRPIEIEQLYEKAWFAITETCLAMTIFREEVGGWFLVMFVGLLVGKVWGWIGEGRVEIVEQQPPANPRLFHARLSFSLLLSLAFDISLLRYAILTVLDMARPTMMVMFAFEFAVLTISSSSTAARYAISLFELYTIKQQTQRKLEERRASLRAARAGEQSENTGEGIQGNPVDETDEVDEADIDVPGWEAKGQWVFYLDLITDFLKLVVYLSFFSILLTFYGLPIHIMRDVFLTLRSFTKRIVDFLRYRRATRDMNERYPDASAEEIGREEVCIICREEMRPWPTNNQRTGQAGTGTGENGQTPARPATSSVDERSRPKKLPCGHILHFGCLRSWLERQQICPTCRRPVMVTSRITVAPANPAAANQANVPPMGRIEPNQQPPPAAQPGAAQEGGQPNRGRIFNLGPIRIGFGRGNVFQDLVQQMQNGQPGAFQGANAEAQGDNVNRNHLSFGLGFGRPARPANPAPTESSTLSQPDMHNSIQAQLQQLEQQINTEISSLRVTADQLRLVRLLQGEMTRLRQLHDQLGSLAAGTRGPNNSVSDNLQQTMIPPQLQGADPTWFSSAGAQPGLPHGLSLPPGWTLLPLHRVNSPSERYQSGSSTMQLEVPPFTSVGASLHHTAHATSSPQPTHNRNDNSASNNEHSGEGAFHASEVSQPVPSTEAHRESARDRARAMLQSPGLTGNRHETPRSPSPHDHPDDGPSPSVSIPAWGSQATSSSKNKHGGSEVRTSGAAEQDVSNGQGSSSTGVTSRQAKGKGRAVTVEDYIDDTMELDQP